MPRPGRLVLVCGRDPLRTSGGSESYLLGQARAARLAGYAPHTFSAGPRSEVLDTDFGRLHRVRSPVRPPRSVMSVLQRPFLVEPICRLLESAPGPHVIHAFGAWGDIAVAAAERLAGRGVVAVPLVTVFMAIEHETMAKHGDLAVRRSPWWRAVHGAELAFVRRVTVPVERRALRRAAAVIVNYQSVARALALWYGDGLPVRRLTYTPPTAFVDPPPPAALPAALAGLGDPRDPLIVSVSRHDGRKGLDLLIDALASLRAQRVGFRACLVGPGLLLGAHRRLVRERGLEDRVAVPGRVASVTPFLQHADVYVLPSRQEGSGSVALLEAMQCGRSILSSDVDGLPEDVTDGVDCALFPGGDGAALRARLAELLADPARRARLGAAARATYERRFAPAVFAAELGALYREFGLAPDRSRVAPRM